MNNETHTTTTTTTAIADTEEIILTPEDLIPMTRERHKGYCRKLRMLGNIHNEIAATINARRAAAKIAFAQDYIPDNGNRREYVDSYLGNLSANVA